MFDGGLVVVEVMLGAAEALDVGDGLRDGAEGIEVDIGRDIGIVVDGLGGTLDEDVEEGQFVEELALYILLEGLGFALVKEWEKNP